MTNTNQAPLASNFQGLDFMVSFNFKTRLALSRAGFLPVCGGPGCNPATPVSDYRPRSIKCLTLKAGR